jgi:hypothetical protein
VSYVPDNRAGAFDPELLAEKPAGYLKRICPESSQRVENDADGPRGVLKRHLKAVCSLERRTNCPATIGPPGRPGSFGQVSH